MGRAIFIALVFGLAGCNQPSPQLWGATPVAARAGDYALTIWRLDDRVEVVRHGYAPRADQRTLRPAMAQAIIDTTGCALRPGTLDGDTGVLRAALDCP